MDSVSQKNRALAEIDASGICARQQWRHWKGTVYTVVGTGLVEKTLDPVVMYAGGDGVVWVRPLHVFLEEAAPGVARFSREASSQPWVGETLPDQEPAHPMMPRPRGGRYL